MANESKTRPTEESVESFINAVKSEQKRKDSRELVTMMEEITGEPATMWGPSIVGFGSYHYKYASGHEGEAPILGFSPRKSALSIYVYTGAEEQKKLLPLLGKHKMGKACMYVNKLDDIDRDVLREIAELGAQDVEATWSVSQEES